MLLKKKSFGRKVSPPQPTFMTEEQMSDYLTNLRNTRPARPSGGRPFPTKQSSQSASNTQPEPPVEPITPDIEATLHTATANGHSHRRANSALPSLPSSSTSRHTLGRPLVPAPQTRHPSTSTSYSIRGRKVSPTAIVVPPPPGVIYRESGERWLERQEALSLRNALQEMDLHGQENEEEKQVYDSARNEASELVWQHRNPKAVEGEKNQGFRNPDLAGSTRNRFKGHLQKGAHARSQSLAYGELKNGISKSESDKSMSAGSEKGRLSMDCAPDSPKLEPSKQRDRSPGGPGGEERSRSPPKKVSFTFPGAEDRTQTHRRKSSGHRNASGGSSKGLFRNPEDQIYEEPDALENEVQLLDAAKARMDALRPTARNTLPRGSRPLPNRSGATSSDLDKLKHRYEVHSPMYTSNHEALPLPKAENDAEGKAPSNAGIEIRSDELRAATSRRMRDRSPRLPTPTVVSDRAGRPIVSFDPSWTSVRDRKTEEAPQPSRPVGMEPSMMLSRPALASTPAMIVSAPVVPTISLPEDCPPVPTIQSPDDEPATIPVISLSSPSVPTLNTPGMSTGASATSSRPLPAPGSRPAARPRTKWHVPSASELSRAGVPTATCAACNLPISGRIVTANRTAMFHPECFTCYYCSTALECVAFYPEPDAARDERLDHEKREQGSADEGLRFFCHLDFHEAFSPKCKNCKTPIEGHVVVACGSTWHEGHFFCAECGDPFDSSTPFVEKDGYAWCVSCHNKRTSSRCLKCRKPVIDEVVVQALGGSWHADCFVCGECGGDFGDDGRFFVRQQGAKGYGRERTQAKELAVCEGCEGRRLKA